MNNQLRSKPLKLYAGCVLGTKPFSTGMSIDCVPYSCHAPASIPKHIVEQNVFQQMSNDPNRAGWSISVRLVEIPFDMIRLVYESQIDAVEQGQ